MKKWFAALLAFVMVFGLATAYASDGPKKDGIRTGILNDMAQGANDEMKKHMMEVHGFMGSEGGEVICFDSLSAMLMALNADMIQTIGVNSETAAFILAQNPDLIAYDPTNGTQKSSISMMLMEENAELYQQINDTIKAMKADGTLKTITEEKLFAYRDKEPEVSEIPFIEGADTIRVAVTGDMPPLDYVSVDGRPAGFNIALLSAISQRLQINIEPVVVEAGARFTALASGRVDAIFWVTTTVCVEHPDVIINEQAENTLITEPYVVLDAMMLIKESLLK